MTYHPVKISVEAGMNCSGKRPASFDKMPVFVRVGGVSEILRPLASLVRLQLLDSCDMGIVDALEVGLATSHETLWRAFNWKLRATLLAAGIECGEFKDEIIERASKVVTNLPDTNRDAHPEECLRRLREYYVFVRGIRIVLNPDGVSLLLEDGIKPDFQISKVFICPSYSCKAAVERVSEIIGHPAAP